MSDHVKRIANPVGYLAEHLGASGAVGTLEDRLAYSLDRCGLVLITEQRLAQIAAALKASTHDVHSRAP